ncbi:acryloyl-CoA reductase [Paenibacillus sp.]|uniref:acrylyl-CoA reductase family protein n=1 Tax=Paenibacillus sp. TaxID=58172 RepID=UPI0028124017|nr:acryloyl-CoA reductase [Paenibacillus sp.]
MEKYRAFAARKSADGFEAGFEERIAEELPEGEVTVRVAYSSVNYKDGLAATPNGKVVAAYPRTLGIDLAGVVVQSSAPRFREGDRVVATGYGLGVSHDGGFAELARLPADWLVPLPEGLSPKEAMALGTAGFTAALSIRRLEDNGLRPERGSVLVTGAAGGVGSLAVAMLARAGYAVTASTGRASAERAYLTRLGATDVIDRAELAPEKPSPLLKQRFAAAIDPVGGEGLRHVLGSLQYGGSAAVSGMAGGGEWQASVFPFILRGVNLLGIDSVVCPMKTRAELWQAMANEWKPAGQLEEIADEIGFDELPQRLSDILRGAVRGRTVVRIGGDA